MFGAVVWGEDDEYGFPISAETIAQNKITKKERNVNVKETYWD